MFSYDLNYLFYSECISVKKQILSPDMNIGIIGVLLVYEVSFKTFSAISAHGYYG